MIRAYLGDGSQFSVSKKAVAYVGVEPLQLGIRADGVTVEADHRGRTPELRLAFYQAANVARQNDPQMAAFYQKMMCERGHNYIQANCAVARKLVTRVWATLTSGTPYELRDLDWNPVGKAEARRLVTTYAVPEHIRRRSRARNKPRRGRLSV